MTKIAYNACYGGFDLSYKGVMRYAEIKGMKIYAFVDDNTAFGKLQPYDPARNNKPFTIYYSTSKTQGKGPYWFASDIERNDPALIQVIEELGDEANGACAELRIEDVPSGTQYRIGEYDGIESVMTIDSYDWKTA